MSAEGTTNTLKYGGKLMTADYQTVNSVVQDTTTDVSLNKSRYQRNFVKPKPRDSSRRRAEDYSSPAFGGRRAEDYSSPAFGGWRAEEHSLVGSGGRRAEEYLSVRSGGRPTGFTTKAKPARELYRPPPTSGVPNILNPGAKEFAPVQASRSCDLATKGPQDNIILNRTGLTITVPGTKNSIVKSRSVTSQLSAERSTESRNLVDLSLLNLPLEVANTLTRALDDPNRVPSRSLMELVKQIINSVIAPGGRTQGPSGGGVPRVPEQAARVCIGIIEKEEKETFLESLINTCQELYHDRERMLRQEIVRWNSYIAFLNQMYGLLKRKQLHFLRKYEGVAPKLVLLSLLAECCTATLTSKLLHLSEVETMFVVLTSIGKDLETETPGRMSLLVTCLREAFLNTHTNTQIGKTLLQLIELRAAGWNLPAQAVMYYYPGSST